jgi:3-hydroxybutyryl-CoA dehydrogenase
MDMNMVGVIGAGVMGRGLAQHLAQTSHDVVLVDLTAEVLDQARDEIAQGVRVQRLLGVTAADPAAVLRRIRFTTDYAELQAVEFLVENATEDWEVKAAIYPRVDIVCPADVVFAANTSAIPITRIASLTHRADRVVGMHFMNPVPMKPTVEVIRGYWSSDAAIERALQLLVSMNKNGIVVNDAPGFVSNRVLMVAINEAAYVVQEGVASAEDADRVFKNCFGHKMGLLETADLIGLDTVLRSIAVLGESFSDSKYRPCPLLKKMVAAGLLGRKSGQGFYTYHASYR